jgi:hypothetical protein
MTPGTQKRTHTWKNSNEHSKNAMNTGAFFVPDNSPAFSDSITEYIVANYKQMGGSQCHDAAIFSPPK